MVSVWFLVGVSILNQNGIDHKAGNIFSAHDSSKECMEAKKDLNELVSKNPNYKGYRLDCLELQYKK